jgi:hypothetical protein
MADGDAATYAGQGLKVIGVGSSRFSPNGQLADIVFAAPGSSLPGSEMLVIATDQHGRFRIVARQTEPLPDAQEGELRFEHSTAPFINNNGQVAFEATIYPDGIGARPFYDTIWSEVGGLHLVDERFTEESHRRFNSINGFSDNGNLLYSRGGYADGSSVIISDDPELLIEESGSSRHLFNRRTPVPIDGCPSGQICFSPYQDFLFNYGLSADGAAIYGIQLKGEGIDTLNNDVQFRSTTAGTEVAIRDGDPAWGLPSGYRFSHVTGPHVLPNGEVIFPSYLRLPSGAVELQESLFANTGGLERLIMRHGAPAPGYDGTRAFESIGTYYATETGRPILLAGLSGDGYHAALFREVGAELSLFFNSDDPAPGIEDSRLDPWTASIHESPVTGATLLSAYWYSSDGTDGGVGLWRIDEQENWHLILSDEQSLQILPGDEREIEWLNPHSFTSGGMLPIEVGFTDGSSALIAWTDHAVSLPGDANGNHVVDNPDYALWRSGFGESVLGGYGADLDGNRVIGPADYVVWRKFAGSETAASAQFVAPEPGTSMLCIAPLVAWVLRRSQSSARR